MGGMVLLCGFFAVGRDDEVWSSLGVMECSPDSLLIVCLPFAITLITCALNSTFTLGVCCNCGCQAPNPVPLYT